ncbi:MAG: C40 family peptidase [Lawsonibacter sp.]|nr:C40 family peptidase [Lawsonibacter sp.]
MRLKHAATRLTAALLLVSSLITPAFALTGTVNTGNEVLRLRAEANTKSDILKNLANGVQVEVLNTLENGWYQVSCGDIQGYVSGKYLVLEDAAAEPPAEAVPAAAEVQEEVKTYVQVTDGPLNIRSGPGTDYDRAGSLPTGRVVEFQSLEDGWYKIDAGYISADYVKEVDASQINATALKGQEVANYALQFVGCRYVHGGTSPKGFDCSGLTTYVYKQFGYTLNRTCSGQLKNGRPVSMSELQPGDLVIFKKGNTKEAATHVGLYIGNNQFVHASTPKVGVIISSMSSAYYTTGFVGGRRIVE